MNLNINISFFLLAGDHTKIITSTIGKNNAMSKFLVTRLTCMNCKTVINSGVVCKNCKHKLREIYLERRLENNYYERIYNGKFNLVICLINLDLWTQCQRCQGSLIQDVICQNKDCPIFYKRIKMQKELKESHERLLRFNDKNDW